MTYVAQPRTLHYGLRGRDVLAVQRVLTRLGLRKRSNTSYYGSYTVREVKAFQHEASLHPNTTLVPDGVIGVSTYRAFYPYLDAYELWLIASVKVPTLRDKMVAWQMRFAHDHDRIDYQELRPMAHQYHLPLTTDCSGLYTLGAQLAGWPDPNGRNYDGEGFTGTLLDHGMPQSRASLQPGDAVFYGRPVVVHVACYVGKNMVVTHGHPGLPDDPRLEPITWWDAINTFRSYL